MNFNTLEHLSSHSLYSPSPSPARDLILSMDEKTTAWMLWLGEQETKGIPNQNYYILLHGTK